MSQACKCDRCKNLFETTVGCVVLQVGIVRDVHNGFPTIESTEVDLCQTCSAALTEFSNGPAT